MAPQESRLPSESDKGIHAEGRIEPTMVAPASVEHIQVSAIDLDDTSYMFRAALRVGPLVDSIRENGLQMPIVVRRRDPVDGKHYQLISGFRRTTAMKQLGELTIAAIVREDLDDDEAAFRASVLENTQRRTYNDIDRALVIKQYEDRGYSSREIASVLGLTERQKRNLKSLLRLPPTVQRAIHDEGVHFSATHGVVLKQLKGKFPKLDYARWVRTVNDRRLSIAQLKRSVNAAYREDAEREAHLTIFRAADTHPAQGRFRLQPVKIDVNALSESECDALCAELEQVLSALRGRAGHRTP